MQPLNLSTPFLLLPLLAHAQLDIRTAFQTQLSNASEVYLPYDPSYADEIVQRWTTHRAPTFAVGVRPATEDDVVATLRVAREHHMPFLATGGGHGYTSSYAALQQGVQIDLSAFNTVQVSEDASTVTVGPGALFRDLFDPVYAAGREIQTGSCSCVSVIGATLGGGIGRYQGLHGLIIDALLSARVLLANGTITTASATSHADLFWALRGAGMNFAIVLSATYALHAQTHGARVLNADLVYPAAAAPALFSFLRSFEVAGGLPPALSVVLAVNWNEAYGGMNIVLNAVYPGPRAEGLAYLAPILNASSEALRPLARNVSVIQWNQISAASSFGGDAAECEKGVYRNMYGLSIERVDVQTFVDYFEALGTLMGEEESTRQTHWIIEGFPNAAARAIPSETTVYPHREAFAHLLMAYVYPEPGSAEEVQGLEGRVEWLAREARANLSVTGKHEGMYVSYGHGDEGAGAWYGQGNVERLVELKGIWDPQGWFGWNNGVLPAGE